MHDVAPNVSTNDLNVRRVIDFCPRRLAKIVAIATARIGANWPFPQMSRALQTSENMGVPNKLWSPL